MSLTHRTLEITLLSLAHRTLEITLLSLSHRTLEITLLSLPLRTLEIALLSLSLRTLEIALLSLSLRALEIALLSLSLRALVVTLLSLTLRTLEIALLSLPLRALEIALLSLTLRTRIVTLLSLRALEIALLSLTLRTRIVALLPLSLRVPRLLRANCRFGCSNLRLYGIGFRLFLCGCCGLRFGRLRRFRFVGCRSIDFLCLRLLPHGRGFRLRCLRFLSRFFRRPLISFGFCRSSSGSGRLFLCALHFCLCLLLRFLLCAHPIFLGFRARNLNQLCLNAFERG